MSQLTAGSATQTPAPLPGIAGHLPALDGVRGLAILMVLLYHFIAQTTTTNAFEAVVNRVLGFGFLGVDLFFVLSGFLITGILYDSRPAAGYFRNFYMRRVLRIFPLYYGVLAVVFFIVPLIPALEGSEIAGLRQYQAWAWLYAVNIYLSLQNGWVLSYIEHFWSLAVEEHFYFVWPLIVWWLGSRPRTLMRVALGIAVLSLAARSMAALKGFTVAALVLTPFQLDALCIGAFFAVLMRQPGGREATRRAIVPMALLSAGAIALQFGIHRLTDLDIEIVRSVRGGLYRVLLAALLLYAILVPTTHLLSRFFRSRVMRLLGKYSYGLYVYHHFLSYHFARHGTEFALAEVVGSHTVAVLLQASAGIGASFAVAWLSYEFFEAPFLRLKRYWPSGTVGDSPSGRTAAAL